MPRTRVASRSRPGQTRIPTPVTTANVGAKPLVVAKRTPPPVAPRPSSAAVAVSATGRERAFSRSQAMSSQRERLLQSRSPIPEPSRLSAPLITTRIASEAESVDLQTHPNAARPAEVTPASQPASSSKATRASRLSFFRFALRPSTKKREEVPLPSRISSQSEAQSDLEVKQCVDKPHKGLGSRIKKLFDKETLKATHHTRAVPDFRHSKDETISHRTDIFDTTKHFRMMSPDPLPLGTSSAHILHSLTQTAISRHPAAPSVNNHVPFGMQVLERKIVSC
jgi:hypothetical protein